MENKDYIFYLNWDDSEKRNFRVGYLAQIEDDFYFVIRSKEQSGKESNPNPYDNGFIGVPGFRTGEIYKSNELFDFFKNRILDKNSKNPCKELSETRAISMIDSFYLEEFQGELADNQKRILIKAYEEQERLKRKENNER